jgi:hypothetical protein
MQLAENGKLLRSVFENDDASSIVFETGYRKSLTLLTLKDRDELIASVKIYHCLIKIKAGIDQFLDGLKSLDVYWYIKRYPELMQLFVDVPNKRLLTAGLYVRSYIFFVLNIVFFFSQNVSRIYF